MIPISDSTGLIQNLPFTDAPPTASALAAPNPNLYPALYQVDPGSTSPSQALNSSLAALLIGEVESGSAPNAGTAGGLQPLDYTVPGQTDGQYQRIPNPESMPYLDQGDSNACGSTSLTMVLNYFGVDVSRQDIDQQIRRVDTTVGATPHDELEVARQNGLEAEGYNNGTWDQVKSFIDQHYPVMASVTGHSLPEQKWDSSSNQWVNDGNLPDGRHQIVITGYEKGDDGKEYVLFHDPNQGGTDMEQRISLDDFEQAWGDSTFGVKNYFMAFAPGGSDLPASNEKGAQGALGTIDGVSNILNGGDRIISPDNFGSFVHGIPELFGGIGQTVGCGIGALFQAGASWLSDEVDGIPVLQNLVQPFTDIVSGAAGALADVCDGLGQACNSVGGAFDSLFNGDVGGFVSNLGDAAGEAASGVVSAVGDAASAVGDAVSDLFSGW